VNADPVDAALERWDNEGREWLSIRDELLERGARPSAFDVTEEQRRRMKARGALPVLENESDRKALGFPPRRAKYLERGSHLRLTRPVK
jgi:hypothetical protein